MLTDGHARVAIERLEHDHVHAGEAAFAVLVELIARWKDLIE